MNLFPACAGVILELVCQGMVAGTFPRVCGGDPIPLIIEHEPVAFSPRVRG